MEITMQIYTRYYWMELTADGRYIDAPWSNPQGYEHSDLAIVHLHMKFSSDCYATEYIRDRLRWKLEKFYGVNAES